ncbi:MAG: hypothetical protein JW834_00735 [Candidatus Diapherotrites archaeon]|nr:hypothetical protein [Candidatus Diapherotrites archaeon]
MNEEAIVQFYTLLRQLRRAVPESAIHKRLVDCGLKPEEAKQAVNFAAAFLPADGPKLGPVLSVHEEDLLTHLQPPNGSGGTERRPRIQRPARRRP